MLTLPQHPLTVRPGPGWGSRVCTCGKAQLQGVVNKKQNKPPRMLRAAKSRMKLIAYKIKNELEEG